MQLIVKNGEYKNADGFLFGLNNFSTFDNISIDELKEMDCSDVFVSLDKNMFNNDLDNLKEVLIILDSLHVKGVLFYDLSVLSICKKLNLQIPLIWNQNYLVTNYKTCNFYESKGVSGAVLSSEITIDEMEEISKNTKLSLFVNAFGYPMMALSKRRLLSSYFDYIDEENDLDVNYMMEKDKKYPVIETEVGTKFLSCDILNLIRYVDRLKEMGVSYLILDGTLIDKDIFSKICDIFRASFDANSEGLLKLERDIVSIIPTSLGFSNKRTIYKVKQND